MGALLIISPLPFEQPELTAEVTVSTGKEVCVCQAGWVCDLLTAWHSFLFFFLLFISAFRTFLACCRIFPAKSSTSHFCPAFGRTVKTLNCWPGRISQRQTVNITLVEKPGGKERKKDKNPFSFGSRSMGRYFLTFALQRSAWTSQGGCAEWIPHNCINNQQPLGTKHQLTHKVSLYPYSF